MPDIDIFSASVFGLSAFCTALLVLTLLKRAVRRTSRARSHSADLSGDTLVFLITENGLVDCNFSGQRFLEQTAGKSIRDFEMADLMAALATRFDGVGPLFSDGDHNEFGVVSRDGRAQILCERLPGATRIKVTSLETTEPVAEDIHRLAAQTDELETLRETTELAPFLVWRESSDGTPIWVNRAYLEAARAAFGEEAVTRWPLPKLFPSLNTGNMRRQSLSAGSAETPRWFEVHASPLGSGRLFTAFDATSTVRAESQARDFMQTLTKTFAQLDIGLAVFDRSRRLALFNPALTDLTHLPADLLANRPTLSEFLDRLREKQMIPEPKDYKTWRKRISDLEAAAQDGSYSETWSLVDNLTYRVTGRPHPDGAIALLFEDISHEMSLTRAFRRELELSQGLLDNMSEATAMFSSSGALVSANAAYRRLWEHDPDGALGESTVVEAMRSWHALSVPTPIWGEFRDFVFTPDERASWSAMATLKDGRALGCRFIPLPGGATQAIFRVLSDRSSSLDEPFLEVV